jgi:GntR family transcriptional regulator / MocR family aminotransferase
MQALGLTITPAHQFPTGAVLAPERRAALLEWAAAHQAVVIEDDYDTDAAHGSSPPYPKPFLHS